MDDCKYSYKAYCEKQSGGNENELLNIVNQLKEKRVLISSDGPEHNVLKIKHEHDGRDLELGYAEKVVDYITTLWGGVVRLDTIIEDEPFEI